ncbi:hypothetical protein LXL04_013036 [Taraxacum kok-saghyz]
MKFKVGKADKARFMGDTWLGDQPLNIRFNHLFHLDVEGYYLVKDRFEEGRWKWNWSRQFSGGALEDQFNNLLSDLNMVSRGRLGAFGFHWRFNCSEAKAAMISILAQERLLGAALGSIFAGVVIFEQRRDIYKTIAQNQPAKSQMKEPVERKKIELAHYWNKSVDQIFGPAIQALSSRRLPLLWGFNKDEGSVRGVNEPSRARIPPSSARARLSCCRLELELGSFKVWYPSSSSAHEKCKKLELGSARLVYLSSLNEPRLGSSLFMLFELD